MAPRSRKKTITEDLYCRKCTQYKNPREFFSAVDKVLDTNGHMSVCKSCCEDVYQSMWAALRDVRKAIYATCKILNVAYDETSMSSAEKRISTAMQEGKELNNVFGMYKQSLAGTKNVANPEMGMTFSERIPTQNDEDIPVQSSTGIDPDYIKHWGKNLALEDYVWLEETLNEWKSTHKCDTMAEETLLIRIVRVMFKIRNEENKADGGDSADLVKQLQTLMKTAAVDPAKTSAANAGNAVETYGMFVKTLEDTTPADFFEDKELFKDYDDIGRKYFIPYVVRAIKNFITGSKDFNVQVDDEGKIKSVEVDLDEDFKED